MNTTLFKNDMFGEIRNVMEGATPWFVANDVARALGYKDPKTAVRDHVFEEDKMRGRIATPSSYHKEQEVILINEAGVYALIFGSKLDSAKQFKKWVFEEVLPSIRKNGFYVSENITPGQLARLQYTVKNQQKKLHMLEAQNEILDRQNDKLIEALARKTSTHRPWYYGK